MNECPCGSGKQLSACCGLYIDGAPAPTAEATMRSRYSAHVLGTVDHLLATLSSDQRADYSREDAEKAFSETKWLGLEIRKADQGGEG